MSRRRYDMSKRSAAAADTRRRIVEATVALHTAQGVLATSWEDIARRAEVAPATVYRHFPTLVELLPACGELGMQRLAMPAPGELEERLADAGSPEVRLRGLVEELFAMYERGGDVLRAVRRERAVLPALQADHERIEADLDALVAVALAPLGADERRSAEVRALTDHDVWASLRERGIAGREAVELVGALLAGRLGASDAGD